MTEFEKGYQQCIKDIQSHFTQILNEMEGDDYVYITSHNINQELLNNHVKLKDWTPELIANSLIFRH